MSHKSTSLINASICLPAFLFLIFFSSKTFAYDATGHRVIAQIAYDNLNDKAKAAVDNILGKKGIVYEATWADEVRSDKAYDYSYKWHYQNLRDSMSTKDLQHLLNNPAAEGEHLFIAIAMMQKRIQKDKTDAEALKFLVHFIGDLHQPMHLGRADDLGGNKVEYNWFGQKTNLHALWDRFIIENNKMSYTEYASYLTDKYGQQKSSLKSGKLIQSVEASYQLRNEIYAYDYSDTNNYHYVYRFGDKLDFMLYRGGIVLAEVLNGIYS
jgi:hypothetical protein